MNTSSNHIIQICQEQKNVFLRIVRSVPYQVKGIFNSEMLLFCAMSKYLGAQHIIESGRARGNSTEILARYFESIPSVFVHSVELLKYAEDSLIAMQRLYKRYTNLALLFGDAFPLLPRLCSQVDPCTVLIDGPKGKYALQLASGLLKKPNVKAVFIHDTHKDTEVRTVIESVYSNVFASDDPGFVNEFSDLDGPCWDVYGTWGGYEDWGPYKRGDRRMQSYGPTLTMIVNTLDGIDREKEILDAFSLSAVHPNNSPIRRLLRSVRTFVPGKASEVPYFVKYHAMLIKHSL